MADTQAEKDAAIERRMAAQRRLHDISQRPDQNNTASIMAFSDTREANEEATLFGTPDDIIAKIQRLRDQGVEYILLNGGGTSRENLRRFAREVMPAFKWCERRRSASGGGVIAGFVEAVDTPAQSVSPVARELS